jgi:hypothetical protein
MTKMLIETLCPFCKADVGRSCKSVEGHKMRGCRRQHLKPREDVNQAAVRIVRETA